ncbi:MAG TPA: CopD family protein [Natrialbaceae archaeon]|nr:CopD family protein [Natrialbaceae archaeon]
MSLGTSIAIGVHLLVAAGWTGSVGFVTLAVLPLARNGGLNATPLERVIDRLRFTSRLGAVLMLLSGGYLAGEYYTVERLTETTDGHVVIGMIVLWLVLTALVEIGAGRILEDVKQKKVRAPAKEYRRWFEAATLVAALLFVDAAMLSLA